MNAGAAATAAAGFALAGFGTRHVSHEVALALLVASQHAHFHPASAAAGAGVVEAAPKVNPIAGEAEVEGGKAPNVNPPAAEVEGDEEEAARAVGKAPKVNPAGFAAGAGAAAGVAIEGFGTRHVSHEFEPAVLLVSQHAHFHPLPAGAEEDGAAAEKVNPAEVVLAEAVVLKVNPAEVLGAAEDGSAPNVKAGVVEGVVEAAAAGFAFAGFGTRHVSHVVAVALLFASQHAHFHPLPASEAATGALKVNPDGAEAVVDEAAAALELEPKSALMIVDAEATEEN